MSKLLGIRKINRQHSSRILNLPKSVMDILQADVGDYIYMEDNQDGRSVTLTKFKYPETDKRKVRNNPLVHDRFKTGNPPFQSKGRRDSGTGK